MPTSYGKYEQGEIYGEKPIVYIYPITKDENKKEIKYKLILERIDEKYLDNGYKKYGKLSDCDYGKIIKMVEGNEHSYTNTHIIKHICAIIDGKIHKYITREYSNDNIQTEIKEIY